MKLLRLKVVLCGIESEIILILKLPKMKEYKVIREVVREVNKKIFREVTRKVTRAKWDKTEFFSCFK